MARSSLAEAKAELMGLLVTGPALSGISAVYDHDPGREKMAGPIALTVTTAAITPEWWTFALRLWLDIGADPKGVQDQADDLMPALTDRVADHFGPEAWTGPNPLPDRPDNLVAEWLVLVGREDF